eukprot:3935147-Rhodomonas_salina.2
MALKQLEAALTFSSSRQVLAVSDPGFCGLFAGHSLLVRRMRRFQVSPQTITSFHLRGAELVSVLQDRAGLGLAGSREKIPSESFHSILGFILGL